MAWQKVSKPSESSVLHASQGVPIGLLLALTYSTHVSSALTGWGKVAKPTTASWTNVAKPTVLGWTKVTKPSD